MLVSVDLETPLVVVFQDRDRGGAGTCTFQANFKSWATGLSNLLFPDETAVSDVAGNLGICHDGTILGQRDIDGVGDIQCQEHGEVDCLSKLYAELAISLICAWNTQAVFIRGEVVSCDCHLAEVIHVRFNSANCRIEILKTNIYGLKSDLRIMPFVVEGL